MRPGEFIFLLFKSLSPANYRMLVTRKKREAVQYLVLLIFFSLMIGFVLSMPKLVNFPDRMEQALMNFEKFNISLDVEAMEPFVLMNRPLIVMDFTENRSQIEAEAILITKSDVLWKKFSPSLFEFRLFTTEKKQISEYNVLEDARRIKGGTYWLLLLFVMPSLFFIVFVFNMLKYLLIISMVTLITFLALRKKRLLKIWRAAVYSSSFIIVPQIILSPLIGSIFLTVISFLAYIAVFMLAMMVVSGNAHE
jgi:hypothetical protein